MTSSATYNLSPATIDTGRISYKLSYVASILRNLFSKVGETVSVKDFGAKGNGVDIDTTAIQSALNSGASKIIFPEGTYIQDRHLGIPSNVSIQGAGVGKTILKMADGVDQIYHSLVSANAMSLDARLADLTNVDTLIGGYITNVSIRDISIEANNKNRPKTYTDREQGTALEMHAVQHWTVQNLLVNEGIQHCINVRAGTNGYEQGYDYVEKYPSQFVRILDCKTYNELLDDGITTHDSEYIWIERCETWLTRNSTDLSTNAISNGIEIDDGSRYVWVTDCYSNGSFGGYQAKGHTNTRPAHHVWFQRCVAENNHMGFVLSAVDSPSTDLESTYATCHHIYLLNCTIKNTYVFSNTASWTAEGHYIQFYNVRHVYIDNLQVIGKTKDMPNMGATQKVIFRTRVNNSYISIKNSSMIAVADRSIAGQPLFSLESNLTHLTINGLSIDTFTNGQVLFTNGTGQYWNIDNVTLSNGSPTYPVFRVNGVGGGTMRLNNVLCPTSLAAYQGGSGALSSTLSVGDYTKLSDGTASVFHQVAVSTDAAGLAAMVSTPASTGNRHVANVGDNTYQLGSMFTQIQAGDIAGTTASGRLRFAVRAAGSSTPVSVMNMSQASLQPANDNVTSVGTAGLRYTQVFAVNGSISTSDATRKTEPRDSADSELKAFSEIARLPAVWQWLQKYQVEGDGARLHAGPTVQACIAILEKYSLNWADYSCFCYDEYEAVEPEYAETSPAIYDSVGNLLEAAVLTKITEGKESGSVYSLRKDELLWWCLRSVVSQQDDILSRLEALESK